MLAGTLPGSRRRTAFSIPRDKYAAVAEVLAYVYQLKGRLVPRSCEAATQFRADNCVRRRTDRSRVETHESRIAGREKGSSLAAGRASTAKSFKRSES